MLKQLDSTTFTIKKDLLVYLLTKSNKLDALLYFTEGVDSGVVNDAVKGLEQSEGLDLDDLIQAEIQMRLDPSYQDTVQLSHY